ncbi:MAG: aldo/keto reductase [Candidatus Hydrogenedentes bacterium]|nr:aldo/keto reductase [Candidatus Hydrogenedentota bacterium]MBI3117141.1 aldo/keto reductase [Candidatus Hydrogenedentota bacterium]
MEIRQFGKTDMQVTALGFGGAEIGFEEAAQGTVTKLLNAALDAGLNVIDTAECYMNSEEMIGQAVGKRRKEYFLFTKCGHFNPGEDDWRPESLLKSVERSLKRLQTDYADLIQLHSCSEEELRKGDVIEAVRTARDRGYARYIGYSGDSRAARYAVECGSFDTLQTSNSIADQEAIDLTLPLAREKNMGVIVKRPIANAAWRTGQKPVSPYHHTYWERLQVLDYDFLRGDVKKGIEIALRFTLFLPGVHTAIVGTTNPERWTENARMLEAGPLSKEQFAAIRQRWQQVSKGAWEGQV